MTAKRIAVFLIDDFADWELGLVLPAAGHYFGMEIVTASLDGRPVRSSGRLQVLPDRPFVDLPEDADLLVLPGSDAWSAGPVPAVTEAARRRVAAGRPVAAICGATLALAHAGLLDDRPHTSNSLDFLIAHAPSYRGRAHYRDQPCVSDGLLVTAPGSSPVSFAAAVCRLLAPKHEEAIAAFVKDFAREHAAARPA